MPVAYMDAEAEAQTEEAELPSPEEEKTKEQVEHHFVGEFSFVKGFRQCLINHSALFRTWGMQERKIKVLTDFRKRWGGVKV